jgi:hypothetical protein
MNSFETLFGKDDEFWKSLQENPGSDIHELRLKYQANPEQVKQTIELGLKRLWEKLGAGINQKNLSETHKKEVFYVLKLLAKEPFSLEEREDFMLALYGYGSEAEVENAE